MQHRDSAGPQAGTQEDLWAVWERSGVEAHPKGNMHHEQGVPKGLVRQLGIYFPGRRLQSQRLGENQLWY